MLQHYDDLVRLLEKEEQVLGQVAGFYRELADSLEAGQLPALDEVFAGGAQSCDNLRKISGVKKELLDRIKVNSLHQLLTADHPAKIRRLVGVKGAAIAGLRRQIEISGLSIKQSLEALQTVNQRFCDFFQQLLPAAISYRGQGGMAENGNLYSGITLDSAV